MKVFLCHASEDKPAVRALYAELKTIGIEPWLDEEDLLPGQLWSTEIPKALRAADIVLVCLSRAALTKAGYVQKEIKYALDAADEQPEGTIFLIPALLEACKVPDRLNHLQYVKLFEPDGLKKLTRALTHQSSGSTPTSPRKEVGIMFYSCFISYSSKDEDFARRLYARLREAHIRAWFAPEDLLGGAKFHEQIETAIRVYDKLLIVLSEASLQSEWVMTELRKGRKAERKSGKRKLFPVRLVDFETLRDWESFDADSGKDLAVELREYFIPDFSNWKDHGQFEAVFSRLLQDLRGDDRV